MTEKGKDIFRRYSKLQESVEIVHLFIYLAIKAYKHYWDSDLFAITNTINRDYPSGMSVEIYNCMKLKTLLEKEEIFEEEHMSELMKNLG